MKSNLEWKWKGKPLLLHKFTEPQLSIIKSFIIRNSLKRKYNGISAKEYLNDINILIDLKNKQATFEAIQIINNRKISKINRIVNKFFNAVDEQLNYKNNYFYSNLKTT